MKKIFFVRGVVILAGLMLCHSVGAETSAVKREREIKALKLYIPPKSKQSVLKYYVSQGEGKSNPTAGFVSDLKVNPYFYDDVPEEELVKEKEAYSVLLPKFFEKVAEEARQLYFFWKSDYKKSDWWKALNAHAPNSQIDWGNDFMAYIYNINGNRAKERSGVTVTREKGDIVYRLGGEIFKKESPSFFKKHWGKIALAGAIAAGSALAYANREDIQHRIHGYRTGGGLFGRYRVEGKHNFNKPYRGLFESSDSYAKRAAKWINEHLKEMDRIVSE